MSTGYQPKRLRLRGKLTIATLILGLCPLIISTAINSIAATSALRDQAFDQLQSVRAMKAGQVETYFAQMRGQIEALAQDPFVVEATLGFANAFGRFPDQIEATDEELATYRDAIDAFYAGEFVQEFESRNDSAPGIALTAPEDTARILAQQFYIVDNPHPLGRKQEFTSAQDRSTYTRLHRRYHPFLRDFMQRFGYQDILIVEPDSGNVVYSVDKGVDFATSLASGPYKDTNIARAFAAATTSTRSVVVDYEHYLPAYDTAAAFIAAPVFDGSTLAGVLIFGMPTKKINAIMAERTGMGTSGESFLVGGDALMRSQSRSIEQNSILATHVDTLAVERVTNQETGSGIVDNHTGNSVLSAYAPLDIEGLDWSILAEIEEQEIQSGIAPLLRNAAITGVVAFIVLLAGAVIFARVLVKPINRAADVATRVAEGHLDNDIRVETADEIGDMMTALSSMQSHLLQQLQKDQEFVHRMTRITQALDNATAGMLVADADDRIVFVNAAVIELLSNEQELIRRAHPDFEADNLIGRKLHSLPLNTPSGGGTGTAADAQGTERITVGSRQIDMTASPVLADDGTQLGTVLEWRDWTTENDVEAEIKELIACARVGDLSQRVDMAGKEGFFEVLGSGINDLVGICQSVMQDMANVLSAMARGDLTKSIETEYEGAFGQLKDDANETISRLTDIVQRIQASAVSVTNSTAGIRRSNLDLNGMMEQQAASLEETASSTEEINSTVHQNASDAAKASELSISVRDSADEGGRIVNCAVEAMAKIQESSQQIADIIGVIDGIAFQTNLLALNASVEAARAGEQGRGFAVVASEVRNLAGRSATAAKEIKDLIEDSGRKVEEGTRMVNESGRMLEEIVDGVKKVTDIVGDIASASREQAAGIDEVSQAVMQMDQLTQKNALLVGEASTASTSLGKQADSLNQMMAYFTVNPGRAERRGADRPWGDARDSTEQDASDARAAASVNS